MDKKKLIDTPYPEIVLIPFKKIIGLFKKKDEFEDDSEKENKPFNLKLCLILIGVFMVLYFAIALINEIEINITDFFIDELISEDMGFLGLFSAEEKNMLPSNYLVSLLLFYILITMIMTSYAILFFKKILNIPDKTKIFSLIFLFSSILNFSLFFFLDLTVSLIVKTIGINCYNIAYNIPGYLYGIFIMSMHFSFYFIIDDMSETVLTLFYGIPFYMLLINNFDFSYFGTLSTIVTLFIFTYVLKLIFIILNKIGFISLVSNFIIYWVYTPRQIIKLAFLPFVLIAKMSSSNDNNKFKESYSYDKDDYDD